MGLKETYQNKIEAQLIERRADIDKMKAKADQAEADVKLEYYKQIETLLEKQDAAQKKLKELKEAGGAAWEDLKAGIELALDSLGEAVKSANSRFK